jgi:hypothetical protein
MAASRAATVPNTRARRTAASRRAIREEATTGIEPV